MPRLFTPSLAKKYEELYQQNGVKFMKVTSSSIIQVHLLALFQPI
jgi:hypothetical protein